MPKWYPGEPQGAKMVPRGAQMVPLASQMTGLGSQKHPVQQSASPACPANPPSPANPSNCQSTGRQRGRRQGRSLKIRRGVRIPAPPAGVLGGSPHSYPTGSCTGALWDKVTLVTCPWGRAAAVLPNVYETHTRTTVSVPKCVFPTVHKGLRPSRHQAFGQAFGRPFP